ncbi:toll/interleukin-1 receptor domain-containing protein [Accumulibacter sp.]|uniref:toll/interleukin-1 receptor domain-containing protein n=1 Tax=Accumulibacter sp. TaxID=2053492 RepID=UPI0025DA8708|nr:toll/interleukin-1 receptor domain-containing protein [Accumulibacter sp.]MCM8612885.1 toll/interleukin-1 receptor domain-containing protein [Accumulibacter sp.]MCM8636656.1 toll/interleukin-1 receptor domain-containing protein [Accumulibacter sp.]MCM8638227.1 toll/interleukin-1 receptor domain-containing protein [Accumulibacter sp.]
MRIIDELPVQRQRGGEPDACIQLLAGDLAAIPAAHAVDALVVSAFPDSYTPNPGTLFRSLFERGLDMREIARQRAEDERVRLGCWLSRPLSPELASRFNFHRIICFEPSHPEFVAHAGVERPDIEDRVGFVFRCLNNFIIPGRDAGHRCAIASVAMPLLATGNQQVALDELLPRLLDAAIFWLEQGLPIRQLKIVAFEADKVSAAATLFAASRQRYEERIASLRTGDDEPPLRQLAEKLVASCERHLRDELLGAADDDEKSLLRRLFARIDRRPAVAAGGGRTAPETVVSDDRRAYDFFISYAHRQEHEVAEFVRALQQSAPSARIFYDRDSIPSGGQWLSLISDAVNRTRHFIAVLSPDYTASPVCWDEFQCAKLKEYNTRRSLIRTLRLYSERDLPPIIGIHSYIDCTEGDLDKLRQSATRVGSLVQDDGAGPWGKASTDATTAGRRRRRGPG